MINHLKNCWLKAKMTGISVTFIWLMFLGLNIFFPWRQASEQHSKTKSQVISQLFKLPIQFESNQGQIDPSVKFVSRQVESSFYFTPQEVIMCLKQGVNAKEFANLKIQFIGSSNPMISGLEKQECVSNYFIGNDPQKWVTHIPNYKKIIYHQLYSGIDAIFYGNGNRLEYDFCVAPGVDPSGIKLHIEGAKELAIDQEGVLNILTLHDDQVRMQKPIVYQLIEDQKVEIHGEFVLLAKNDIGFKLGKYDISKELIIDPVLVYSTYLGGNGTDIGFGIAVDSSGNAYVAGSTTSTDFPVTGGAFQTAIAGATNAFITKFNSTGTALVYSTYLGGSGFDQANAIAIDSSGNAYVTGLAGSANFPTTVGAFQTVRSGINDAFVTKLNTTGTALVYSTYLGGSGVDFGNGIAVDSTGNAYVTGRTTSANFPTTVGAFQTAPGGGGDAFVTKFNTTGTALVYSTYLGGSSLDIANAIAINSTGNAYVTGQTASANFPITGGAFQTALAGSNNAFITEFNTTGTALVFSTYVGGNNSDIGRGIALDSSNNVYITGFTSSSNFPTTAGAFQTTLAGANNVFVTKMNTSGTALVYSTFLGGTVDDRGFAIKVDSTDHAYVTGVTNSSDFPVTPGAFQTTYAGFADAFLTKFNASGSALVYSTFFGGTSGDEGNALALDSTGNPYITGDTTSPDLPVTAGAFQTAYTGTEDAFVSKFGIGTPTVTSISPTSGPTIGGTVVTITGTNFSNATAVNFGSTPATSFIIDSDTQITAVSPPGLGTVDVTVTTPGGTSATSPADEFTYIPVATTTTLTVTPNPSFLGQNVTLSASVSPSGATGSVNFFDGATLIGSAPLIGGTATLNIDTFSLGTHSLSAVYLGNDFFSGSTSNTVILTVFPPLVFPPTNLKGVQKATHFATQTDRVNIVTWNPPTKGTSPVKYKIYRDKKLKQLLAEISSKQHLKFEEHNRKKGKKYTYFIVSIDAFGSVSTPASVTIKGD